MRTRIAAAVTALALLYPTPVVARPPDRASVVAGDARFEVLSPTLVRMEYAGDAKFVDAATFNAIGRASFRPPAFSTERKDGWLTIRTSALSLRYKLDSGPFTADNVAVRLANGVTARPTFPAAAECAAGALCEAENASLDGVSVAADHSGYTGSGFVAGFEQNGGSLTYQLKVATAGPYVFRARYANAVGGDGQSVTRTLTLTVDGTAHTLTLPVTGSWDTWGFTSADLSLTAGKHSISVSKTAADSGHVNLDSLAVTAPDAGYPPGQLVKSCTYGAICEAENGNLSGGASAQTDHNGFSGDGFAAGLTVAGASDAVRITGLPADGAYDLQLRYANVGTPRSVSVDQSRVTLAPTSSWDSWRIVSVPVSLRKGDNTVTIGCPDADSCHLNLDTVAVTTAGAAQLLPHAPLGGYRRGLDGVNGSARTTPGLLYQDGWYLLDDTASAIFDGAAVSPRPGHGGTPYQDGYLFGYGTDFQHGLSDLATLTGPSILLPRWAYGVWYSKYYDYHESDYRAMLAKFRSEGVPLDVLVTDTDIKSPDTWDGWQIDTTKFPDPTGFFDWSASMGLHNTINIHPSVLSTDPQFAQAMATAKGKLTKAASGCYTDTSHQGDCYVFDWSDPDQLKAYFDLHKGMERQGVDFWWLDWCCEPSRYSAAGVTPDAWINYQYANRNGFAFSRAFGSLQAGGYSGQQGLPTGPWADKRTTVHFTGDTTSSWDTLRFEVGYTPGEAASTGLSATSHDIGGFNANQANLPDDLYVRWSQLAVFQPIFRFHGNHSNRLPWEYGDAARVSVEKSMNLRERLVPYTYSLARLANRTGVPIVRPTYLQYPNDPDAYAAAGGEYFYGPDVLVAPATDPGTTATTSVWVPPGSWTDYFTGRTYTGPSTVDVKTDWSTMPVLVRAGGILSLRSTNVANDVQNPLTAATLDVAVGANGRYALAEDGGATTAVSYADAAHRLTIAPARQRTWTVRFLGATAPRLVLVDGRPTTAWQWNADARTLTVNLGTHTTVSYH
ncbi:TIM-barrel domain-containing protein [Fodinicola acaciae]|uniref:TIM-barrel domain-containing protein n=1 Tax=Fodinicola acaciae TaxID=2681555 RepID=UPI0013D852C7|nr:TIM-barrel domain-containing protein [Fodinicola acaciae]